MAKFSTSPYGPDRERQLAHLASSVGHQIINAFSAVVSNAELLKLSPALESDPELVESAEVVIGVSINASKLARRLIEFTRPSTEPMTRHVDFASLIQDVVAEFSETYPHVRWMVDCDGIADLLGDPPQLKSMLGYLFLNAIEAMPASGGCISIRPSLEPFEMISGLQIEDDGQGMDTAVKERALEPFFSTRPGRLGIGLTLANSIWRRHGGTLTITSRPGKGTSLRMSYKPLSQESPAAQGS